MSRRGGHRANAGNKSKDQRQKEAEKLATMAATFRGMMAPSLSPAKSPAPPPIIFSEEPQGLPSLTTTGQKRGGKEWRGEERAAGAVTLSSEAPLQSRPKSNSIQAVFQWHHDAGKQPTPSPQSSPQPSPLPSPQPSPQPSLHPSQMSSILSEEQRLRAAINLDAALARRRAKELASSVFSPPQRPPPVFIPPAASSPPAAPSATSNKTTYAAIASVRPAVTTIMTDDVSAWLEQEELAQALLASAEATKTDGTVTSQMMEARREYERVAAALAVALDAVCRRAATAREAATAAACHTNKLRPLETRPFRIEQQPRDGDCLFHSLADQMSLVNKSSPKTVRHLRDELGRFMVTNPHLHVAGEPLSYWVGHSEGLSVADYAAQVHRLGVWGGALEMAAVSHIYHCDVYVYQRDGNHLRCISRFEPPAGQLPNACFALLYVNGCHYESIHFQDGFVVEVAAAEASMAAAEAPTVVAEAPPPAALAEEPASTAAAEAPAAPAEAPVAAVEAGDSGHGGDGGGKGGYGDGKGGDNGNGGHECDGGGGGGGGHDSAERNRAEREHGGGGHVNRFECDGVDGAGRVGGTGGGKGGGNGGIGRPEPDDGMGEEEEERWLISIDDMGGYSQLSDLLPPSQGGCHYDSSSRASSSKTPDKWGSEMEYDGDGFNDMDDMDWVAEDQVKGGADGADVNAKAEDGVEEEEEDHPVSQSSAIGQSFTLKLHDITGKTSVVCVVDKEPFNITIRTAINGASVINIATRVATQFGHICCLDTPISMNEYGEASGLPVPQITLDESGTDRVIDIDLFESTIVCLQLAAFPPEGLTACPSRQDCSWKPREDAAEIPLPQLSDSQLQLVANTLNNEHGMQCLMPEEWLNDEVINASIALVNVVNNNFFVLSTHFFAKLMEDGVPSHSKVARWTKGLNIFALDRLAIPIHLNGNHWALAVINFIDERLEYFDSLGFDGSAVLNHLAVWLRAESMDKRKVCSSPSPAAALRPSPPPSPPPSPLHCSGTPPCSPPCSPPSRRHLCARYNCLWNLGA